MIDSLIVFAGLYSFFYLVMAIMVAIGELRYRNQKLPEVLPSVSVVVCARNEERSIRRCLDSLVKLDYPRDKMEILLVDDESEDSTRSICNDYAEHYAFIKALSAESESHDLPAKQRPLNQGIRESSGEIVLITDADCTVQPGWIKGHIAAYDKNVGIVGGITKISRHINSLFARIQGSELAVKFAVAMGSAGIGLPVTIMGNNFSIRRAIYQSLGGFSKIESNIVEDMALMNAIVRNTEYSMSWAGNDGSVVETDSENTLQSLVNQRLRWISELKNVSQAGKVYIGIEMLMAFVFTLSIILALHTPLLPVIAGFSWCAGYCIMMCAAPELILSDFLLIPCMIAFQFIYGFMLLRKSIAGNETVEWKGRTYSGKKPEIIT